MSVRTKVSVVALVQHHIGVTEHKQTKHTYSAEEYRNKDAPQLVYVRKTLGKMVLGKMVKMSVIWTQGMKINGAETLCTLHHIRCMRQAPYAIRH
jgi:hypothetical protein